MSDIHPTAVIDSAAQIGADVVIGPYVVIDGPVVIKDRVRIISQAHICGWTTIDEDCVIHPFAAVGGPPQDHAYKGDETYCRIGARTVLREGVTVHRGTKAESETRIGADCLLMVNSHVAHNCEVGDHVTLTNDVLLAGHVTLGHHVMAGGCSALHQFVRVGEYAMIGGGANLTQNVAPFTTVAFRNRCIGLNRVGMRRNGIPKEDVDELKNLFRAILRAPKNMTQQATLAADQTLTPSGKRFIEFVLSAGPRGVCKPDRTFRDESTDID